MWAKLLGAALLPLHVALLLGLSALVLSALGWRRLALVSGSLAVLTLWIAATPRVAVSLARPLEARYPPTPISGSPTAQAIVVLGGSLGHARPPRLGPELVDASDRILHAARLFRAGKAPVVVPSGGQLFRDRTVRPEAEEMTDLLVEWGVPRSAVLLEPAARTTHENARDTARLLRSRGVSRVLLVTSALHMERALRTFRAAGLECVPSPCDYAAVGSDRSALALFPSPSALALTHAVLWERLGLLYYRLRGFAR